MFLSVGAWAKSLPVDNHWIPFNSIQFHSIQMTVVIIWESNFRNMICFPDTSNAAISSWKFTSKFHWGPQVQERPLKAVFFWKLSRHQDMVYHKWPKPILSPAPISPTSHSRDASKLRVPLCFFLPGSFLKLFTGEPSLQNHSRSLSYFRHLTIKDRKITQHCENKGCEQSLSFGALRSSWVTSTRQVEPTQRHSRFFCLSFEGKEAPIQTNVLEVEKDAAREKGTHIPVS